MKEASKAMLRRLSRPGFATRYFAGLGLDIGTPSDPIGQYTELFPMIKGMRLWNGIDGDAQHLTGLADSTFDFVHASNVLQRQPDPGEALRHWIRVLKPGGYLIATVPDEDLYEQGHWPSRHNLENRWTFTLYKARSWSPVSINLLEMIPRLGASADLRHLEVVDDGFRYGLPRFDQTLTPIGECAIEFVIRKRPQAEAVAGGRIPPDGNITANDVFLLTGLKIESPKT